jgi:tetratricopeptide (TPR) repeat protein
VACACLWLSATPALAELTSDEIREMEELLERLGFDAGVVDGIVTDRTAAAIRGYQIFAALPINGQASEGLLTELRAVVETLSALKDDPSEAPEPLPEPVAEAKVAEPAPVAEEATPPGKPAQPAESTAADPAPVLAGEGDFDRAKRGFAVQFATMSSAEAAWREWARLKEAYPDLLTDLPPKVATIDRADGGVYYRVLAGLLPNRATAADLCAAMKDSGQDCILVSGRQFQAGKPAPPEPPPSSQAKLAAAPPAPEPLPAVLETAAVAQAQAQPQAQVAALPEPAATETEAVVLLEPASTTPQPDVATAPEPAPVVPETQVAALPDPAVATADAEVAAPSGQGLAEFTRAGEAFANGDCEGAVNNYTVALELGGLNAKDTATAHNNRGRCYYSRGRYDEALADYGAAIELQPDFAAAYFNRGRVYQARGLNGLAGEDLATAYQLGFRRLGGLTSAKE